MILKFLHTTPSQNPDFPFQAGQRIEVPKLTPEMRGWIKDGFAVLVGEEIATAVVEPTERAVVRKGKAQ